MQRGLCSLARSPTEDAKELTTALHFNQASTPITIRFSSSTGLPHIPDTDSNSDPRGFAIRFNLGEHKHTDIITQSSPYFPVSNGEDFLQFLQAIAAGKVPDFLGTHPAAVSAVRAPKPTPKSLATQKYFSLSSFKFIDRKGTEKYFRYQLQPDAGIESLSPEEVGEKSSNFLYDEIHARVKSGPVSFSLLAQLANPEDITNDATVQWPENRRSVKLGTVTIDEAIENDGEQQRTIIFDPIPRIDGIETSDDPLLDFRAAVYLISGRERRAAGGYTH